MNSNPCLRGIPKLDAAPPDKKVDMPILISSLAFKFKLIVKIKIKDFVQLDSLMNEEEYLSLIK